MRHAPRPADEVGHALAHGASASLRGRASGGGGAGGGGGTPARSGTPARGAAAAGLSDAARKMLAGRTSSEARHLRPGRFDARYLVLTQRAIGRVR
jgi:hypothetical protein